MILYYIETTSGECFSETEETMKTTWLGEVSKITKISHGRFRIDFISGTIYPKEDDKIINTLIIYPANIKQILYKHGDN